MADSAGVVPNSKRISLMLTGLAIAAAGGIVTMTIGNTIGLMAHQAELAHAGSTQRVDMIVADQRTTAATLNAIRLQLNGVAIDVARISGKLGVGPEGQRPAWPGPPH